MINKIVFFSYPYADAPKKRKKENRKIIKRLRKIYPDVLFISPLMMFDYLEDDRHREDIMNVCKSMIENVATELWYIHKSSGVIEEILTAINTGIPVIRKEV
jgi:hypothetical protein